MLSRRWRGVYRTYSSEWRRWGGTHDRVWVGDRETHKPAQVVTWKGSKV